MFKNYIKITFRNFLKNKSFSIINISGLALGIACTIMILLFVQDELSYDQYHANKDKIIRFTRDWKNQNGEINLALARVAPPFAPLLKNDFPNIIEEIVRVKSDYKTKLKVQDEYYIDDNFFWAEGSYFKIFDYKFLSGNPETALQEPNSVVLTEDVAKRYFGNEDPIGKIVNYEDEIDLKVTGVIENIPQNSHFVFSILGSFKTLEVIYGSTDRLQNFGWNSFSTYALVKNENLISELEIEIPEFLDRHLPRDNRSNRKPSEGTMLHIQRLTNIHLHSHLSSEVGQNGNITYVYLFSAIAFFVLLIACINFMNLSTARSTKRAKEIGMRKVLGADKNQLIYQFIGESLFLSFFSLLLALAVVHISLPSLNSFLNKSIALNYLDNLSAVGGIILITFLVGIISGSYPAVLLSSFKPAKVLKGESRTGTNKSMFRTVLVVAQFSISIILIVCMGVVYNQMNYLQNKSLGFQKEHVVTLAMSGQVQNNFENVKNRLMQNSNITNVSRSDLVPTDMLVNSMGGSTIDGDKLVPVGFRLARVQVDYDFFETYNMDIVAGRSFSKNYASDDSLSFILNEAAVKKIGWNIDEAVGKPFSYGNIRNGRIVGIVKDFHFESLHNEIVPILFMVNQEDCYNLVLKASGVNITSAINNLENIWNELSPEYPFTFSFLEDEYNALYSAEKKLGEMFNIFTFLATFIACLGLFGLAAFSAEQKTKEIGIRKVLGATVTNIVSRFSLSFIKLVLIANIFAWPIAYYAMELWLSSFAYKIDLGLSVFLSAAVIAILIALFTIMYQALKAALANPVKSLKYE